MSQLPLHVRQTDIDKMIAALSNFRGAEWWWETESSDLERSLRKKRVLSPLVLQNMKRNLEANPFDFSEFSHKNALSSAIHYNLEARRLSRRVKELEAEIAKLTASE